MLVGLDTPGWLTERPDKAPHNVVNMGDRESCFLNQLHSRGVAQFGQECLIWGQEVTSSNLVTPTRGRGFSGSFIAESCPVSKSLEKRDSQSGMVGASPRSTRCLEKRLALNAKPSQRTYASFFRHSVMAALRILVTIV